VPSVMHTPMGPPKVAALGMSTATHTMGTAMQNTAMKDMDTVMEDTVTLTATGIPTGLLEGE
jgi:hypothetical protein